MKYVTKEIKPIDNMIIVASAKVFATGINMRNLHNLIFASSNKSNIQILQSLGRALRLSDTKISATLFDVTDDLIVDNRMNYMLKHLLHRISYYKKEKFPYKIYRIPV